MRSRQYGGAWPWPPIDLGSTTAGYAIRSASEGGSFTCNNVHGGWGGIVSTATVGMIGGSGSNDANWAHGNEFGLTVFNGTTMQGNVTGTMADGMAPDPNGAQGIYVEGGDGCTVTGNLRATDAQGTRGTGATDRFPEPLKRDCS